MAAVVWYFRRERERERELEIPERKKKIGCAIIFFCAGNLGKEITILAGKVGMDLEGL